MKAIIIEQLNTVQGVNVLDFTVNENREIILVAEPTGGFSHLTPVALAKKITELKDIFDDYIGAEALKAMPCSELKS